MNEYVLIDGQADQPADGPFWSRTFLQPVAPGALTTFSDSLITEIAGGAWFRYFDRLNFDPTPKTRVVRVYQGRPYVNESISAELEAQHAGLAPRSIRLNGSPRAACGWEKPGLLSGLRLGRNARKIGETLETLEQEIEGIKAQAASWWQRTRNMRWSQAEILQIMEEIERVGARTFMPYFAVRRNLEQTYQRLLEMLAGAGAVEAVALVNQALAGLDGLVEVDMARRVATLAERAATAPAVATWLQAGEYGRWQETLPAGDFADGIAAFLERFGHRAIGEGELSVPRWFEDPTPVFRAILACGARAPSARTAVAQTRGEQALLDAIEGKARKDARQLLGQLRRWLVLQSKAVDVYAYVLSGTRSWALAAGREAMGDGRLTGLDDVFSYQLEEMKQMMTGEWNISDLPTIHATAAERKQRLAASQRITPGELLIGAHEAQRTRPGLPAAPGSAHGIVATVPGESLDGVALALAGTQPDSGWAIFLPAAAALVAAQGHPLDPIVAAARELEIPAAVALAGALDGFSAGTPISVDGDTGQVKGG